MTGEEGKQFVAPFNGPIETGLRALAVLNEAFPTAYSMQRLLISDYLIIHSDDVPGGPAALHPRTPYRGGELLVRRSSLQAGLLLYESRGLIVRCYESSGVFFAASERSAAFLDTLSTDYIVNLRARAGWLVANFSQWRDPDLELMVRDHLGQWGAEFTMDSVLWREDTV